MQLRLTLSAIVFFMAVAGSGCSFLISPAELPIIEDHSHSGRVTTLATIPSRRLVILTEQKKNSGNIMICAEPSADVSDNIVSSFSAAIKAPATSEKASVEMARSLSSTAEHLFTRTQGLQFYRDGMYNLCQALVNRAIDGKMFRKKADDLLNKATTLMLAEIPYLHSVKPKKPVGSIPKDPAPQPPVEVTAPQPPVEPIDNR